MAATGANYAFDLFEPRTYSNAAPQWEQPAPEREREPIRKADKKPGRQAERERRVGIIRRVVTAVFLIAVFSQLAVSVHLRADLYEVDRKITRAQQQLAVAYDENVRLNAKLNSYTSVEKIVTYATEELGMVKAERYQIECIDLSEGSQVLFTEPTGFSSIFGGE